MSSSDLMLYWCCSDAHPAESVDVRSSVCVTAGIHHETARWTRDQGGSGETISSSRHVVLVNKWLKRALRTRTIAERLRGVHDEALYIYTFTFTFPWNATATRSECTFSFRIPPRTEDRSVPVVIPWCDLTMYCALSVRPSLSADLSPCTGCLLQTDFIDIVRWSCSSSAIMPPK